MIGGTGFSKIELEAALDRKLVFAAAGYTNAIATDIGKAVEGVSTGDTGTLISYDNTNREWIVRMDDEGDLFAIDEVVNVTAGTGSGTTTESPSSLNIVDSVTFTKREEENIFVNFYRTLARPDLQMANEDVKRFTTGQKLLITVLVTADDWVTTTSVLGYLLQKFIVEMYNHTGRIKITPHTDKANQCYYCMLENDYEPSYAFGRWKGIKIVLEFKSDEKIDSIDIEE